VPPAVPRLYFWALQVGFVDGRRGCGAAHLGLQAHPGHPGGTAVNWGGYRPGGGKLDGSASGLPSALGNPNTRDFPWRSGRPYALRVAPAPTTGWRGSVTDLRTGEVAVVRDLFAPGSTGLTAPVVWSEVFARCEHPSTTVRWTDLHAVTADGARVGPAVVRVGYQRAQDGGCTNTSALTDGTGILQVTATRRRVAAGTVIAPPRS
jgi:hypothetical protein